MGVYMNKKIEYLIIITSIILLIYGSYSFMDYKYMEKERNVTDSITMYYPSSSGYEINGNNYNHIVPGHSDGQSEHSDDRK